MLRGVALRHRQAQHRLRLGGHRHLRSPFATERLTEVGVGGCASTAPSMTDQPDAGCAGIFSRRTNWTQDARPRP
eukprot:2603435-Pyramimonas_sp.AAC.1